MTDCGVLPKGIVQPVFEPRTTKKKSKRVVFFDRRNGSVDLCKEAKIDINKSIKLQFPKGKKQVSIFLDQKREGLTTERDDQGDDDIFLARLNLDHLGFFDRTFLHFGGQYTLYVSAPWEESASSA
ncbi:hypothetical protein EJ04DRAFT_567195 [Polyplosphaeria fusca]|uniref:Uncharacterized protein n=1 Tax=Polyplosphaeria fusca TaxID=682080 RepID=A0A9P4UZD9_9PLEO|nr:hypothetical protein EJ04DRAFT_567195 [Polyplosphaeria fusca]